MRTPQNTRNDNPRQPVACKRELNRNLWRAVQVWKAGKYLVDGAPLHPLASTLHALSTFPPSVVTRAGFRLYYARTQEDWMALRDHACFRTLALHLGDVGAVVALEVLIDHSQTLLALEGWLRLSTPPGNHDEEKKLVWDKFLTWLGETSQPAWERMFEFLALPEKYEKL